MAAARSERTLQSAGLRHGVHCAAVGLLQMCVDTGGIKMKGLVQIDELVDVLKELCVMQ